MASDEGTWVTINGQHILIKDGENAMTAYIRHMGKLKASKKKKVAEEIKVNSKGYSERKEKSRVVDDNKVENTRKANMTDNEKVNDDIATMIKEKYKVDDKYLVFGQINETGEMPSRDKMIDYFIKKGTKEGNTDIVDNSEKLADKFIEFAKTIPSLKEKMLEERKKRK